MARADGSNCSQTSLNCTAALTCKLWLAQARAMLRNAFGQCGVDIGVFGPALAPG